MEKYLLIDANNLSCRSSFKFEAMMTSTGIPSGVHFGDCFSLISLKKAYPDYKMLLAWDGKSARRAKESEEGVKNGIVPSSYKANRKKDELPKPLRDFYSQADYLKKGLAQLGIPQIHMPSYEADDVLASYAKRLGKDSEVVLVTSDKDYFQMLSDNVSIWNGMTQTKKTVQDFRDEWGIEPNQWIDVGALTGDTGDNIIGLPGFGEKTAIKELLEHKTYEAVIQDKLTKFGSFRNTYKDLNTYAEGVDKFNILKEMKSDKGILKYPNIKIDMPFTGVAYAFESGECKLPKTSLMCLIFQDRVRLAYSLKKSDDEIPNLPEICWQEKSLDRMMEYFDFYEINKLKEGIKVFFD